jgi:hypothetical protein
VPQTRKALDDIDSVPTVSGLRVCLLQSGDRYPVVRRRLPVASGPGSPAGAATEAADRCAPLRFVQSALGHGSVAVTEKYYAKYAPEAAAKQLPRVIEEGDNVQVVPRLVPRGTDGLRLAGSGVRSSISLSSGWVTGSNQDHLGSAPTQRGRGKIRRPGW